MSQREIMAWLDDRKGKIFTAHQIVLAFKEDINERSVYASLKQIIKQEGYFAIIKKKEFQAPRSNNPKVLSVRLITYYGAKHDN